jgi:mRNA-degrading endonuclease RelE of RelBE toxin-antitoxin system
MRYTFVFTKWFDRNLRRLQRHNPKLRQDLETFLEDFDASSCPVIRGTGGARKARMKGSGRGKSGSYRVIYYLYFANTVWLITVYDKVQKEELTTVEKEQIRQLIQAIKQNQASQGSESTLPFYRHSPHSPFATVTGMATSSNVPSCRMTVSSSV